MHQHTLLSAPARSYSGSIVLALVLCQQYLENTVVGIVHIVGTSSVRKFHRKLGPQRGHGFDMTAEGCFCLSVGPCVFMVSAEL